jgi:hypothetical protein
MNSQGHVGGESWWRRWVWLFPATYAVHIAEEYLGGPGFATWVSRAAGRDFTARTFLAVNACALGVMLLVSAAAWARARFSWVVAAFGVVAGANAVAHAAATAVTRSYCPGTLSGVILWLPLGMFALSSARRWLRPAVFVAAVIAGIGCLAIVAGVAVTMAERAPVQGF